MTDLTVPNPPPVALSEGELAEWRLQIPGFMTDSEARLLATIESRDQRISHLEEAADIVLKAAPFGDSAWLSALSILMDARADRQANPVALSEEEE